MDCSMMHIMTVGDQLDRAGISYMFHNNKKMTVSFHTPEGCKVSNTFLFDKPVWEHGGKDGSEVSLNNKVIIPGLVKGFRTLSNDNFGEKPNMSEAEKKDNEWELQKYWNTAELLETLEDRNNTVRDTVSSGRIEIYSSYPDSVMAYDSARSLLENRPDSDFSLSDEREKILRKNLTDMEDTIHKNIHFPEGSLVMFDFAEGEPGATLSYEQGDISFIIESLHRFSEVDDPFAEIESAYGEESFGRGHMAVYIDKETGDLKINTDEPMRPERNHTYVIRQTDADSHEKSSDFGRLLTDSDVAELMDHSEPIGGKFAEAFGLQYVMKHGLRDADDQHIKIEVPLSLSEKLTANKQTADRFRESKAHFKDTDIFDKSAIENAAKAGRTSGPDL